MEKKLREYKQAIKGLTASEITELLSIKRARMGREKTNPAFEAEITRKQIALLEKQLKVIQKQAN